MTISCQHCGADIADDPEWDLEEGLVDEFVCHTVHPEDSIAVAQSWYYCDAECFIAEKNGTLSNQQ